MFWKQEKGNNWKRRKEDKKALQLGCMDNRYKAGSFEHDSVQSGFAFLCENWDADTGEQCFEVNSVLRMTFSLIAQGI